jgi:hypothetical protein
MSRVGDLVTVRLMSTDLPNSMRKCRCSNLTRMFILAPNIKAEHRHCGICGYPLRDNDHCILIVWLMFWGLMLLIIGSAIAVATNEQKYQTDWSDPGCSCSNRALLYPGY